MNIGGEIEYELNAENNGSPQYFCPQCQEKIEEVDMALVPEPAELGLWRTMAAFIKPSAKQVEL